MTPPAGKWPIARALSVAAPGDVGHDLAAGLTLAAIAIPEQMANARLGGFAPEIGLIAFVAASVAFALFGRNRFLSIGADSTITPIFAGALTALASATVTSVQLASLLALMVGVLVAAAGALKLGRVADLISKPVLTGFLAGIAVHIVLSQAPVVMGVAAPSGTVWVRLQRLWAEGSAAQPLALAAGLGTFAVVFLAEKLNPRIPGALIALAGATLLTAFLKLDDRGLQVLGRLHGGFPGLQMPLLNLDDALSLFGLALMLSLVVMVQTGAVTRAFNVEDADVNGDFIGAGAAGLAAGLFGAMPVNASPPRTALTAEAGGRSQWSGMAAAAAVLALLLFGAGLLTHTPSAALGGILLFIATRLIHLSDFQDMLKRAPGDFALALTTVALIVVLPIQTGVALGIFLSLLHGVFIVARARLVPFEHVPGTTIWWPVLPGEDTRAQRSEQVPGVLVMGFPGPLSFLNVHQFHRAIQDRLAAPPGGVRLFVLEASGIIEVDFTAAEILRELIAKLHDQGVQIAVARLSSVRARADLDRFGLTEALGQDRIFLSVAEAVAALTDQSPNAAQPSPLASGP
jgi:MFS superfamily sulfate permease-like transporter